MKFARVLRKRAVARGGECNSETLAAAFAKGARAILASTEGKLPAIAGNGRLARNTLEKAIFHQSRRLVAEPVAAPDVLLPSDLELE